MVIFADSREMLPAVVDWVMLGIFFTTGQICSATSRLIVEASLYEELLAALQVGTPSWNRPI
jgi:betaine-aldehyde dehydrogenase